MEILTSPPVTLYMCVSARSHDPQAPPLTAGTCTCPCLLSEAAQESPLSLGLDQVKQHNRLSFFFFFFQSKAYKPTLSGCHSQPHCLLKILLCGLSHINGHMVGEILFIGLLVKPLRGSYH